MIYPVEFIKMTIPEPEEMGAPPIHDAFAEASKNAVRDGMEKKWSHKAVRYAYNKTSSWSLSHEPAHVIKPVFESFYLQGCLLAFEGKILDQIEIESPQDKYDRDRKKQIAAMSPYARSAKDHLDAIRRALK
jgi:hypothetical protein